MGMFLEVALFDSKVKGQHDPVIILVTQWLNGSVHYVYEHFSPKTLG